MKNLASPLNSKRILFLALVLVFVTGCQLVTSAVPVAPPATPLAKPAEPQSSPAAPLSASPTVAAPVEPAASPTLAAPVEPVASPTPAEITSAHPTEPPEATGMPLEGTPNLAAKLTPTGPWLVILTSTGLYAVNEDGSGLTRLAARSAGGEQVLSMVASPDGRSFAYITGSEDRIHSLKLSVLTLPDGQPRLVTALTNAKTEPGDDAMLDAKVDAARAITDLNSLAWSPDGKTLAFIGVQIGPSADLYTYTPATGKINRLTDGPSQAYGPSWSPDGKYIVQYGVTTFGTGAGYSMAGAWAARSDGSAVIDLGKPGGSGEQLVGWLDADSFLTYSWSPVCGPQNLTVININDKTHKRLVTDCFTDAVMALNGAVMVAGSSDLGSGFSGIALFEPGMLNRRDLSAEGAYRLRLVPDSSEFRVDNNAGTRIYSMEGTLMSTPPASACSTEWQLGTFGAIYGWTCAGSGAGDKPGVWINGPGIPEYQIFNRPAHTPTMGWHNMLLFFDGSTLFRAAFFDYVAQKVVTLDGEVQEVMWVRKFE